MTSTPNKGYPLPVISGNPNTWGVLLNQGFGIVDTNLGGLATINCAGNSNVTITSTQASNLTLSLTGALTGNIYVYMPAVGGFNFVENNTSGSYTVTLQSAGGGLATVIGQGTQVLTFNDTSNQYVVVTSSATVNSGNILANLTSSVAVPSGNTVSAVLDYVFGNSQGNILYRGGSGWAALAPGTSGQLLQTAGAAANPAWATVTGTGSVVSVGTGVGLTGGPITLSGTIGRDPLFDEIMVCWYR